jgi:hypothetical protein
MSISFETIISETQSFEIIAEPDIFGHFLCVIWFSGVLFEGVLFFPDHILRLFEVVSRTELIVRLFLNSLTAILAIRTMMMYLVE